MSNKTFVITDIHGYVKRIRTEAAKAITEGYDQDDLDNYITLAQVEKLVYSNATGFSQSFPMIDEDTNERIVTEVITWIYNAARIRLAAKGELESAWDDEKNEMIFWKAKKNEPSTNNQYNDQIKE